MDRKLILLTFFFAFLHARLHSQIVSNNCFIKGDYLELGIGPCGVFGTTVNAPPGYHPRGGDSYPNSLGFVADYGKDGWDVGTPSYCGDYYVPGAPEEGWGISMNGKNYNNNELCETSEIPGRIIQYTNNGVAISGTWQGMVNGAEITAKTSVPLNKLYFLTEVTIRNVSSDTIRNLYYMRNIDPDNEATLTDVFDTRNTIVSQNPNPDNRAVVMAEGLDFGCFIGLGTRDCRARVAWGGFSNRSAINAWNCAGDHVCSGSITDDLAITISFKLGDVAPGRQVSFKFVNVLNLADIDEAVDLTGPSFLIGGNVGVNSNDTTQICSSGPTELEVINIGGYDSWQWSPAIGLNTTVGPRVICDGNIDTITYTAAGSNACGSFVNIRLTAIKGNIVHVPKAGPISGPINICDPADTLVYSIAPLPQATNYTWRVPPGSSILSGEGTNSISLSLGSSVIDSIWVYGTNVCGAGEKSVMEIRNLKDDGPKLSRYIFFEDSVLCEGRNSKLKCEYSIVYGSVTNFQWYKDSVAIPGATDSVLIVSDAGVYSVRLTTSFGCDYKMGDTTLIINPMPVAAFKIPDGCIDGSFIFEDSSFLAGGTITKWNWKKDGIVFSTIQDPVINFPGGLYNIELSVMSDQGCWSDAATTSFLRYGKPEADFSVTGICSDSLTQFNSIAISPGYGNSTIVNWNWDFGNSQTSTFSNPSLIYDSAGYYDVKLTFRGDNCAAITNKVVRRIYLGDPLPAMKYNNVYTFQGDQFVLNGGRDGVSYTWTPTIGLTNPNNRVTTGSILQSQVYNVHIVNSYGCGRVDTVLVVILNGCKLYSPTAFTPNQDGLNDKFRIYFGCLKTLKRFTIYNRWGQQVFITKDSNEGWDGNYKGIKQAAGSYIWIAEGEYTSGEKFAEKGIVTLIR